MEKTARHKFEPFLSLLRNVQQSLIRAKLDVMKRAEANGFRSETRRLEEIYFQRLFAGLEYQVEFQKMESENIVRLIESDP